MALPTIPAASISLSQVNVELTLSASATITMNDAAVRTLFGKVGSGNTISMSDGSNKSNFTVAYSGTSPYTALANNAVILGTFCGGTGYAVINYKETGVLQFAEGSLLLTNSGSWGTPTGGSPGSNYWIRFTRTATSGSPSSTANTAWLQLNTAREASVSSTVDGSATYTIEIASGSGGTPLLTTRTGIKLEVFDECAGG
jgi:hypothetical protein